MNGYAIVNGINSIISLSIAVVIFAKKSRKPIQLTYGLFSLLLFFWAFFYFIWGFQTQLANAMYWFHLLMTPVCIIHIAYLHFILIYTNNSHNYRKSLIIGYLSSLVFILLNFSDKLYDLSDIQNKNPFLFWPRGSSLLLLVTSTAILYVLLSYIILIQAIYREKNTINKVKLKLLLILGLIGWIGAYTNWFNFYKLTPIPPVGNPGVTIFLIGSFYLIIKHDLLALNLAIKRTFVYGSLTLFITLTYAMIIVLSEKLFQSYFGYSSIFGSILAGLIIALAFNPFRSLMIQFIEKNIFGKNVGELSAENVQMKEELQKQDQ